MAREMTKNYYFRKFQCGLTKKDAAELCFKSVRTITRWDSGQTIPPECRRLMRMYTGIELVNLDSKWKGWKIKNGFLINERGITLTPEQVLTGYALLEIGSEKERSIQIKIMEIARKIRNIPNI